MRLTNQDMVDLVEFRHALHRKPELSGEERETARAIVDFIEPTRPDKMITNLGGHGVAAIFEGAAPGPSIMFRCELDGLPIEDIADVPYKSTIPGKGHLCGHDGHMTIISALARGLHRQPPQRGRVILMYQPAEENGSGAEAVLNDPKALEIKADYAFALHNRPGVALGEARLRAGPIACASRGMLIKLTGRTSHASTPRDALSPMPAMIGIMQSLTALGRDGDLLPGFRLVTITHAHLGEPSFGITPGDAEIRATLRTLSDDTIDELATAAEQLVRAAAERDGLKVSISYSDNYHHTSNHAEAVAELQKALEAEGVRYNGDNLPTRGCEDFGLFGRDSKLAIVLLGSGENVPNLHNPDFDFPDALIGIGARIFMRVIRTMLG